MTPVQIAYFKHFLYDAGVNRMYVYRYRHFRIKGGPEGDENGNPESLEQFFMEQPHFRVIMKAFYFEINSQYGHDFWHEVNKKWLKYWELHEDNINNPNYINLKGSFSILRQNWDKPQFWKSENLDSLEETYKRMGIEPPIPLDSASSLCKFKVGDIIQSHISDEVQTITAITAEGYELEDGGIVEFDKEKYWMKIDEKPGSIEEEEKEEEMDTNDFSEVPEAQEEQKAQNDGSLLEGFSLVETANSIGGRKMSSNTVSVNLRNGGYRITFSTKVSEKLRKNAYKFVKLLTKQDTKEVALIFNNQSGCVVSIKKNPSSDTRNVTINSKEIVEHIHKFYGLKKVNDYFTLEITATIQQDLNTIFKLKMQE